MNWGNGEIPNMGDFDMNNMPSGNMQFGSSIQGGSNPGGSIGSANSGAFISVDAVLLIVSVAVLLAGLVFAAVFKRRR